MASKLELSSTCQVSATSWLITDLCDELLQTWNSTCTTSHPVGGTGLTNSLSHCILNRRFAIAQPLHELPIPLIPGYSVWSNLPTPSQKLHKDAKDHDDAEDLSLNHRKYTIEIVSRFRHTTLAERHLICLL